MILSFVVVVRVVFPPLRAMMRYPALRFFAAGPHTAARPPAPPGERLLSPCLGLRRRLVPELAQRARADLLAQRGPRARHRLSADAEVHSDVQNRNVNVQNRKGGGFSVLWVFINLDMCFRTSESRPRIDDERPR